jgi:hypothetical protein
MSDFDFDHLGDIWRQQPDPAEMARLQQTAAAVARRARLSTIFDIAAAVAVAVVVLYLAWTNPTFKTLILGAGAILILLGSNLRQRRLRQVELKSLTGTTEEMLDQSIDRIETTIRHNRFSLVAIIPAMATAYLFAATAVPRSQSFVAMLHDKPMLRLFWNGVVLVTVLGIILFLLLSIRRGSRERDRLKAMRQSYREESEAGE